MNNAPKRYHAYLLRLWPEATGRAGPEAWRATLENARTGERLGFSCLEELFAHLMQVVEDGGAGPAAPPGGTEQA